MRAAAGCLDAEHLSVLDGRTLNVCVRLPAGGAGRSGAWLRVAGRARPLEVAGERAFGTYVLEPEVSDGAGTGRRRGAGAGHGLDVIAVREGDARELGVELAVGGRRRRGYGLRAATGGVPVAAAGFAADPGAGSAAGPTLLDPPHPDGWRITFAASGDGGAVALRVVRLPPHAEVERVETGWTELAVHGRVVGPADAPPVGRWTVRLPRSRAAEDARRGPAPAGGGEFGCELVGRGEAGGVCALPVADGGGGRFVARVGGAELTRVAGWSGEREWEVRVRAAGYAAALPVGRLLGDVADPGRVHRLPNRLLIADSGAVVRIAPRYTAAGRLVVVTEAVGEAR
ncbi:hypothetical protein [Streptomyces sp. NPDC004134]|uniref:hypothetical protein n=1 Tax=Streptomyces sp. NPDC004134 TaxID=3364691 RepID=UPI0036972BCC